MKYAPKPINPTRATPPITPPTIAPVGLLLESDLSFEEDDCVTVVVTIGEVLDAVDEIVLLETLVRFLQTSFCPMAPAMQPTSQNLITLMSPLVPPRQLNRVLAIIPWSLELNEAAWRAASIWAW